MTEMNCWRINQSIASVLTLVFYRRYKKVIAVVGFNPNKKYAVTPQQRVDLLRDMLQTTSANNVSVEGTFSHSFALE